jgi:flagellar biogenesis protein FliO
MTGWLIWLAANAPLPANTANPAAGDGVEWWRLLLLVLLMGALFGFWWWVNRGRLNLQDLIKPKTPEIKVIEQRWLQSRISLLLVEVDGRRYLLATTPHSVAWQPLGVAETIKLGNV